MNEEINDKQVNSDTVNKKVKRDNKALAKKEKRDDKAAAKKQRK